MKDLDESMSFDVLYADLDNKEIKKLEHSLHNRSHNLKFDEKHEKRFLAYYAKKFHKHIRLAILLGTIMFLLSYLVDFIHVPSERASLLIRFGIVGPVIVTLLILTWTRVYDVIQQQIALASTIALSLGALAIIHHMPGEVQHIYMMGFLLVLIYGLAFSRLLFRQAIIFTFINFVALNTVLALDSHTAFIILTHNYMFACGCVLLLTNNYAMEYAERQDYLQNSIIEKEHEQLEQINKHLHELATQDGLTGLINTRHFKKLLKSEWKRAKRYQYPVSLLLFDFDNFKTLNDTYGHQGGDDCLKQIGDTLKRYARRPGDAAIRYGGDEFILMLVGTDIDAAEKIAEKVRKDIVSQKMPNKNSDVLPIVTTTVGVASIIPVTNQSCNDLFRHADKALYVAKERGRNCVECYQEAPPPVRKRRA